MTEEPENPIGRPTDYRPEFCKKVRKAISKGATISQIADLLNVDASTVYRWKNQHDDFCDAITASRDEADSIVESALFQRAIGFEVSAVKIFCDKDGNVTQVPYREIVAPDTTAAKFWLTNRRPEQWQDKVENRLTGKDGGAIEAAITVEFVKPKPS